MSIRLTRVAAERPQAPVVRTARTPESLAAVALSVFAEVDRGILSGASSARIIQQAVRRGRELVGCDALAVTLLDVETSSETLTFCCSGEVGSDSHQSRAKVLTEKLQFMAAEPDGCWARSASDRNLLPLPGVVSAHVLRLPIFKDAALAAVLSLGVSDPVELFPAQRTYARDLADRLGVAITVAARGEHLRVEEHYDPVTRLPNRRLLQQRISEEIARARRAGSVFGLLFIGLDKFGRINDDLGHTAGDQVLETTGRRLKTCLREQDVVARFGSDEFVAVLPAITGSMGARAVAEKVLSVLSQPFQVGEQLHHLGASIGVCMYPEDGTTMEALLRRASSALSRAKETSRGRFLFYKEQINAQVSAHAIIERELREALHLQQLVVEYQPQIELRSGRLTAAEALVRWQHPQRGLVTPGEFIAVAEHSGLIEDIGDYVRQAVCKQYRSWSASGIAPGRISVNVSSREIRQDDFVDRLAETMESAGVRPDRLELEITESLLVDDSEHALDTLRRLHDRGFRIALDDFGTGYSCLAYLKRVPFDVLKIDRAFVRDIDTDDASDAILTAIIRMAQSLGKEVVCEGVETDRQRIFLTERGCDVGQGYFWSRARPPQDFARLISEWGSTTILPPG